jgi:hypothetical protein
MMDGFTFFTEQARFINHFLSLGQVVPSQEFVICQKPYEKVHPWGNFDGPHTRNMNREDPSKIYDFVKGLRGVLSM